MNLERKLLIRLYVKLARKQDETGNLKGAAA